MSQQQSLKQHLFSLGLVAEEVLVAVPDTLTLSFEDGVLCLNQRDNPLSKLQVDFVQGALSYRSKQHLGAENLIKACQIKGQKHTSVLDGTCGLGTDSFLLHQAGFEVFSVEKNIITYALLLDGIRRHQAHSSESIFNIKLGDVHDWVSDCTHDVIYLDPMFPGKIKSAKNKKTMQLFQSLHENAKDDADELLHMALKSACKRVVIKRPSKSPILSKSKPTFQVTGKTCRFDAYQLG